MFLVLAAYLGGVLTILSPYILSVPPFVFARSDQPFTRSDLTILLGMAITFAAVASLAAVGGGWVVGANYYGRLGAILLMALFGITLLLRRLSERVTRPIVALGARPSQTAGGDGTGGALPLLAGPGCGHGAAADGRGPKRRPPWHNVPAPRLCRGRRDAPGRCPAHRGQSLHRHETIAGGGRMDTARARHRCARQCCRDRVRPRHRTARASVAGEHERGGAGAHRSPSCNDERFGERTGTERRERGPVMKAGPNMMMMAATQQPAVRLPVEGQLPSLGGAVDWLNRPPLQASGERVLTNRCRGTIMATNESSLRRT